MALARTRHIELQRPDILERDVAERKSGLVRARRPSDAAIVGRLQYPLPDTLPAANPP